MPKAGAGFLKNEKAINTELLQTLYIPQYLPKLNIVVVALGY
jgi:hypothetical protein